MPLLNVAFFPASHPLARSVSAHTFSAIPRRTVFYRGFPSLPSKKCLPSAAPVVRASASMRGLCRINPVHHSGIGQVRPAGWKTGVARVHFQIVNQPQADPVVLLFYGRHFRAITILLQHIRSVGQHLHGLLVRQKIFQVVLYKDADSLPGRNYAVQPFLQICTTWKTYASGSSKAVFPWTRSNGKAPPGTRRSTGKGRASTRLRSPAHETLVA